MARSNSGNFKVHGEERGELQEEVVPTATEMPSATPAGASQTRVKQTPGEGGQEEGEGADNAVAEGPDKEEEDELHPLEELHEVHDDSLSTRG